MVKWRYKSPQNPHPIPPSLPLCIKPSTAAEPSLRKQEKKRANERHFKDMRHNNPVLLGLVLTAVAVFSFFATTAAAYSHPELGSVLPTEGHEGGERSGHRRAWPCCDRCGGCTNTNPPQCQCQDLVRWCHLACRSCLRSPLSVTPPMYQCMDRIPNFCHRRCTPLSLLGQ